jgi:hypothetical protein
MNRQWQEQIDWTALDNGSDRETLEAFKAFHAANPVVYIKLIRMLRRAKDAGRKRVGMAMLFEVLRWNHIFGTKSAEPFKLNNNYQAYYTRLIELRVTDL